MSGVDYKRDAMSEAEKSNERQVAYSNVLCGIRQMSGRRTVASIFKMIRELSDKDNAWKLLPKEKQPAASSQQPGASS